MKAYNVESFNFDHTLCAAPFIRRAGRIEAESAVIRKYDLRLTQPNQSYLDTASLHSFEHLFAELIRNRLPSGVVDFSPMGCRTGFYLITLNFEDESALLAAIQSACRDILEASEVPACNERQCGNYRDHSLEGAKTAAKDFLSSCDFSALV